MHTTYMSSYMFAFISLQGSYVCLVQYEQHNAVPIILPSFKFRCVFVVSINSDKEPFCFALLVNISEYLIL